MIASALPEALARVASAVSAPEVTSTPASLRDCIARCAFAARLAAMLVVFREEGAASSTALARAVDLCARVEADGVREEAAGVCEEAEGVCEEAADARMAAAPDRWVVPAARAVFVFDCADSRVLTATLVSMIDGKLFDKLVGLVLAFGASDAILTPPSTTRSTSVARSGTTSFHLEAYRLVQVGIECGVRLAN